MKLRYAFVALLAFASSAAMAQVNNTAANPELVVNAPAVLSATISNYDVDIEALPRPPYALPDTSASILLGYSVWTGTTPVEYTPEGVTADVVLALNELGEPAIGCTSDIATPPNPSDIANTDEMVGKIAFIARGVCSFVFKADNARQAGAIGVIIYNPADRTPDTIGGMSGEDFGGQLNLGIPAMLLPWAIAGPIFDELASGNTVNATMRQSRFFTAGEGRPSVAGAGLFITGQNPTSTTARLEVRTPAAENVTVAAYNMLGQQVAVLYRGAVLGQQAVTLSATNLPSGTYFVRAVGETFSQTQQITIVR